MSRPESDRADGYLTIPDGYAAALGGLRWSHGCDAIESGDGVTLALVDQLSQVLEGVFAAQPIRPNSAVAVPPFAFVLHLLKLMKSAESPPFARLRAAYADAGPAGAGRTAGLLIAELCRSLPGVADPPGWPQVALALQRRMMFGERRRVELEEVPPLPPPAFATAVAGRLSGFDDATLAHWLRHGRPPVAGEKLAREVARIPVGIGDILDVLRKRPRLVGAVALAPALDAALTFPPRKPRPDRLPLGGYADVATRGNPDQLLPSQFALDGAEFVRRFAERELLYFKREEPHRPAIPERWLVLDQGVRAWGTVRLGLAAAVVALLGKDAAKAGPVRLAVTSADDPLDPVELSPEAFADHLEASDLSVHPANALGLAVDSAAAEDRPRDVVLLTTPRAVLEPDVRAAAHRRRAGDRLFALTVADDGRAAFGEWGASGFVPTRNFLVDLDAAAAAKVADDSPPPPVAADDAWSGDVEPIGFPFRAGLVSDIAHIGFDAAGEWVVVVGRDGCVQAKHLTAGSPVEVLPRAYRTGDALTRVEAVVGVTGGVVVCGKFGDEFAAAHYDFSARGVKLHTLPKSAQSAKWQSFPDLHCVVARWEIGSPAVTNGASLDLGTNGLYRANQPDEAGLSARGRLAWVRATSEINIGSPCDLPVRTAGTSLADGRPCVELVQDTLLLHGTPLKWATLRPMAEGKPLLEKRTLLQAQLAGDVLAVQTSGPRQKRVFLFRGPDSRVLAEIPAGNTGFAMRLSADGGRFAIQTSGRTAVVRGSEPGTGVPLADLGNAGLHSRVTIVLEPHRLRLRVGRFEHGFALTEVPFRHDRGSPGADARPTPDLAGYGTSDIAYDRGRFPDAYRAGPWIAAFDRWGQVVLLSERTGKVVLAVVVRRDLAAAWLPDGTRWGSAALLGGGPHPNAAVRIGLALRAATAAG